MGACSKLYQQKAERAKRISIQPSSVSFLCASMHLVIGENRYVHLKLL